MKGRFGGEDSELYSGVYIDLEVLSGITDHTFSPLRQVSVGNRKRASFIARSCLVHSLTQLINATKGEKLPHPLV